MKIILTILLVLGVSSNMFAQAIENDSSTPVYIEGLSIDVTGEDILKLSIQAIDLCFTNIANGVEDKNFPDSPGPYNMPFPRRKTHKYNNIYHYSFTQNGPHIVTFLIGVDGYLGLHLAVIINIQTMEVISVFNRPGS